MSNTSLKITNFLFISFFIMTSFLNCNRIRQNSTVSNSTVGNSPDNSAQSNPKPKIAKAKTHQVPVTAPSESENEQSDHHSNQGNQYPSNSLEGQIKREVQKQKSIQDFKDNSVDQAKAKIKHAINRTLHESYNTFEQWKHQEKNLIRHEREMERNFTHQLQGRIGQKSEQLNAEKIAIENAVKNVIREIYQIREQAHKILRSYAHYKNDQFIVDGVNQELHAAKANDEKKKSSVLHRL
jgi:hypothetical protein